VGGHEVRTYYVLRHPSKGYIAIKHGFCWPGFFFTLIWALFNRLWVTSTFCLLAYGILAVLSMGSSGSPGTFLMFLIMLFFGAKGNDLKRDALLRWGCGPVEAVVESSPAAAIATVMERKQSGASGLA
jgi:uncharacterized protein DUF2628